MTQHNLSGVWKCTFWFPSNDHDGEDSAEYVLEAYQRGSKLSMDSRPRPQGGHMTVNLNVEAKLATGSWIESTNPDSDFEGLIYTGAMQLIVKDDGTVMDGGWVGAGRERLDDGTFETRMYNGRWLMERLDESSDETADGETGADDPAAVTGTVES